MGRRTVAVLAAAAVLGAAGAAGAATLDEPGHTLRLIADSVAPLHPTQTGLGTNPSDPTGAGQSGIESITVDRANGLIYVQTIVPYGGCPSQTTAVYQIVLGSGVTTVVNPATGFGVCERGTDIDIDPATGLLVLQDEFVLNPGASQIRTLTLPFGAPGVWSTSTFPTFMNSTFGMDFALPGSLAIPPGDIAYISDGPNLNLLSAGFGGPEIFWAALPGPGDDIYIQPDGDIVFIGEVGTPITTFDLITPAQTTSPLGAYDAIWTAAGLPAPLCGTRSVVCDQYGQGLITWSCIPGGDAIFRLNEPVTSATQVLTMAFDEGIQDVAIGPPSSGSGGESLYMTVENYTTGAHQVWEITDICNAKGVVPKWSQLPHGWGEPDGGQGAGFNVASDLDWPILMAQPPLEPGPGPNVVVADDFLSDGRPITCVRWWGSYLDDLFEPPADDPFVIDGWLVSFHTDVPAVENPDGDWSEPGDLLGLYFLRAADVELIPTGIVGWDGHRVYEYVGELEDACLLHQALDPRDPLNPFPPAQECCFGEEAQFIYWIDIQAVVGHTLEPCAECTCDLDGDGACTAADVALFNACFGSVGNPACSYADLDCDGDVDLNDFTIFQCLFAGTPPDQCCPQARPCVEYVTGHTSLQNQHFWGWHTSPDLWQDESTENVVLMGPDGAWIYPPEGWRPVDGSVHELERVDQAFELLTPECLGDFDNNGSIGFADLNVILAAWGPCPSGGPCPADLDCNGSVGFTDLNIVLGTWGPCP